MFFGDGMKKLFFILFLTILTGTLSAVEFMDVNEIKPGMKGYGLSVFRGWEPEQFGAEIIDVMKNTSPKGDIILARLSGPVVEKSGVIAGMSGSPVYIEGKLIGAVAYTWAYSREPLCGITPIKQMISEKNNARNGIESPSSTEDEKFKRIATPLFLKGFTGEGEAFIKDFFEAGDTNNLTIKRGSFFVMNSSGVLSGTEEGPVSNLKAGDSVAVNLVDGDYRVEGIGTVTYVSNDDVFIFGHPMDLAGNVPVPISRSYIYSVVPSLYFSFKLGSSSVPIGSTVYDGQDGVYCRMNESYSMIPVDVRIEYDKKSYAYHFRVADNRYYFSSLTTGAISSSFLDHAGYLDDKRINLKFGIEIEYKKKTYEVSNDFHYAFNPSYFSLVGMIADLNLYLSSFYENNIGGIKIKNIHSEILIEKGLDYYILDNLTVDKSTYYPGDIIHCKVQLKQYGGNYIQKYFDLKIPSDARSGQYWLLAGSESQFYAEAMRLFPKYYTVNNIDDLVRFASFRQDITRLSAGLIYARPGVIVKDKKLEKFPENYLFLFDYNKPWDKANAVLFPEWIMDEAPLEKAVFGMMKINVAIGNKLSQSAE